MNNQSVSKEALRKRKRRETETADEKEVHLSKDRKRKKIRVEQETEEEHTKRLVYQREKSMQRRTMEKENRNKSERQLRSRIGKPQQKNHELQQKNGPQQKNHRPQHRSELHHQLHRNISDHQLNNDEEPQQNSNRSGETSQNSHGNTQQTLEQFPAAELNKVDRNLLKKFRNKMDNIKHVICPVCNESCPSIVLVNGKCRWCHSKKMSNRFSEENNMDPGEVPEELQDLTEIEEMLIAKAFTVMSVYRLRGGQYGYRGNVINFPQDVHELATRLP